ncbi:hypothetical protein AGDE_12158 [Angomonas deanei]|uniref:Cysteine protease n=1 Tax=Angomonas deanei TaxID=59799 RepID=A0A7G2CHW8_9TRYP|nr:hypothetical protein AGDE_12158 [Angomonas deanei]CAD2218283.1 Peptidase family C54, putative [Angomonas deanei]|eukprot:EPY24815.1 hypothetical protein AGDE_12158 [Angomonas deanei]
MLVAHYLRLHGDPRDAKNLFYYFDDWSEYCIFSIHNLIRVMWTKKPFKPANWSPSQGCEGLRLAVQEARKKGLLHTALQVECSVAGTVYVEDIRRHWKEGAERVLLLVNLQAGKEDTIPATLADTVLQYLKEPECVGAVGGYGKQAYYIIGLSGSEILYLDPHLLVQRALSADHTTNVVPTVSNVRSFGVTSLSSSLFVAFAIDSPAHWDALHERLQRYEHKLFQVEPGSAPLTREQKAKRRQEGSSPLRDPSHSDRIESFSDDSS